jgi:hypothetical protein
MENGVSRKVIILPAYDKRDPNPNNSYGTNAMMLVFGIDGPDGCVRFQINTGWNLPHIQKEVIQRYKDEIVSIIEQQDENEWKYMYNPFLPHPSDLSYHSHEALAPGEFHSDHCEWLSGTQCWFYGTSSEAKKVFDIMVRDGDEAMWKFLEDFYRDTFRVVHDE